MKALTLTQPWATLVAIGAKRIETRGWSTLYQGPLAIHAAKAMPAEAAALCLTEPFRSVLLGAGYYSTAELVRGEVIAVVDLVVVASVSEYLLAQPEPGWYWNNPSGKNYRFPISDWERAFGHFAAGRYAWLLDNVRMLDDAAPARGSLGLWEWNGQGFGYSD